MAGRVPPKKNKIRICKSDTRRSCLTRVNPQNLKPIIAHSTCEGVWLKGVLFPL